MYDVTCTLIITAQETSLLVLLTTWLATIVDFGIAFVRIFMLLIVQDASLHVVHSPQVNVIFTF